MYHNYLKYTITLILLLAGLLTGCASSHRTSQGCPDDGQLAVVERHGEIIATVCAKGD